MSAVAEADPATDTPPPARRPRVDALAELLIGLEPGQRLLFEDITWTEYERLLVVRGGRRRVRMSFHHGRLEVVAHSSLHEGWKLVLSQLLTALAIGLRSPCVGVGNMTIRRELVQTGLEPDDCYYVQTAGRVRDLRRRQLDFDADPPPDLAIEVEITRDAAVKLPLYAALGVPEVWRWDGTRLLFLHLTPAGEYAEATVSRSFPVLTRDVLHSYLVRSATVDEIELCREFLAWADAARTATPGTA